MRLRFFMAGILALLVLVLPQSISHVQAVQAQKQRFGAGWLYMPASYEFERYDGPDFHVDYLFPKDAESNEGETTMGLYTGFAPSFEAPSKGVKIRAGHFGARKIKWHIWKSVEDNETVYHREALIKIKGGFLHLFLTAPNTQRMQELMSILKSYRTQAQR